MRAQTPPSGLLKSGLYFVLLFGAVNLFADMTYEGARSITGPFLATLGASGFIVGTVTGFGEFLGYALRFVSGRWADRSRLYWPITLAGYLVQMVAVPALAMAGSWPTAALLILLERVGRAIRNPPCDVMLARAGERMGRGWAFGVNEALDQLGALIGPLAMAAVLVRQGNYPLAFGLLAIPAIVTLLLVLSARLSFPNAGRIEREVEAVSGQHYPPAFWWYLAGAGLVGFGFADYSLIAYHFSQGQVVSPTWVPIFYALAMGAGGLGSLVFGKIFDRFGLILLAPVTVLVAAYAPLAFLGNFEGALMGALVWGIGLDAHESGRPQWPRWFPRSAWARPTDCSARLLVSRGLPEAPRWAGCTTCRSGRPCCWRSSPKGSRSFRC
jgi:predicted MFS family arabinose efflux permease